MTAITSFDVSKLERLRQRAARAPIGGDSQDLPDGWHQSRADLMKLLAVFRPLRIKDGFTLRAYLFRSGGNGNGVVWAMKTDAPFPAPQAPDPLRDPFSPYLYPGLLRPPPKPPGALKDVMQAIEGDGTPWSYVCASVCAREIGEFGACWHGCGWSDEIILGVDPWRSQKSTEDQGGASPMEKWKWEEPKPTEWSPKVKMNAKTVQVSFYTYTMFGGERIVRVTDSFKQGLYTFKTKPKLIAMGPGCIMH